ncbi:DEAD-domain-containing protein [Stipitochalara longipes BDJ]|nr:DEAD-domain-containing protein [Stipitochalara longipes BDJ]
MFNACRRGPASITKAFRATTPIIRTPSTRPSTLSLSVKSSARPVIEARWLHVSSTLMNQASAAKSVQRFAEDGSIEQPASFKEITKFQELVEQDMVHPNVIGEITKGMGHHTMTEVQTMTINQGLQGTDIVAQARTGTGKTLGFLVPTIQNILRSNPDLAVRKRYSRARASDIRAIIISPTRELAEQIAVEAGKLCYNTDLRVQVATGGNSKRQMLQKTQYEGCHLLVATPGRLTDLLSDEYSGVRAPNLTTLVLDEADRLLDDGFSKDIEEIMNLLPNRNQVDRQTLLFSATIPKEVMHLVRRTLKPNFHFVQTVKEGDLATHEKVPQKIAVVPGLENYMPTLLELCKRGLAEAAQDAETNGPAAKPFKAIVYFSATTQVQLAHRIFDNLKSEGGGMWGQHPLYPAEVSVMHGQLTQMERTRASDRFRRAKSAILFSTDVTARGMDFPNVTHVIQLGLPPNKEQYIHRIGRTGRGDKAGEGWLIINQAEVREARNRLRGLPITPDKTLDAAQLDMTQDAQLPKSLATTLSQVADATKMVDRRTKEAAYMGSLGHAARNVGQLQALNQWTRYGWGYEKPPAVSPRTAQRMGLAKVPGMNIGNAERDDFDSFDSESSYGDRGAGGRGGFGDRSGGFSDRRQGGGFSNRGGSGGGFGGDRRGGGRGGARGGGGSRFREEASF